MVSWGEADVSEYDLKFAPGTWRLVPDETRVKFLEGTEPYRKGHRAGTVRKIGRRYVHIETDIRQAGRVKGVMVKMPIEGWNGFDRKVPGIRRLK